MRMILHTAAFMLAVTLSGCDAYGTSGEQSEADHGARLIAQKGCGYCHIIPGIADADGLVGPPLDHMASRIFIAGTLRNSPENLARWIRSPQDVSPGNAMPDMGLNHQQARAIAACLETLK